MLIVNKKNRGFTLIELMIVVAIIGVLASLAIYGVRKYLLNAKTAEARASVGSMAKAAVASYERETGQTSVIALGTTSSQVANNLCTSATAVPSSVPAGRKYQSQQSDWDSGDAISGWRCLKFSMNEAQYFQYNYTGVAGSNGTFTAAAMGDLDGDAVSFSTFRLAGAAQPGGVQVAPTMEEILPEE